MKPGGNDLLSVEIFWQAPYQKTFWWRTDLELRTSALIYL